MASSLARCTQGRVAVSFRGVTHLVATATAAQGPSRAWTQCSGCTCGPTCRLGCWRRALGPSWPPPGNLRCGLLLSYRPMAGCSSAQAVPASVPERLQTAVSVLMTARLALCLRTRAAFACTRALVRRASPGYIFRGLVCTEVSRCTGDVHRQRRPRSLPAPDKGPPGGCRTGCDCTAGAQACSLLKAGAVPASSAVASLQQAVWRGLCSA